MDLLAPLGPVYQAGTLSGNPLAMAAGLATLDLIMQPGFYAPVVARCQALVDGYNQLAKELGVAFSAQAIGTMGGLYTLPEPPNNFAQINTQDIPRFKRFYHSMLEQGIYLPPSPFEAFFFSSALTDQDVEQTLAAAKVALVA
jgi:glutamate-1-semialdehyde 2,1-aminomutase